LLLKTGKILTDKLTGFLGHWTINIPS
jgi:hypothetical protein